MQGSEVMNRSNGKLLGALALAGAVALIAVPAIKRLNRRLRNDHLRTHPRAQEETAIDKSLKDTYPASDPPASRYVDIPVNRR